MCRRCYAPPAFFSITKGGNSLLTYEWLADAITQFAETINGAYQLILQLLCETSWFTQIVESNIFEQPISAIKATAITLCALFFLIDFFTKTLHLQWVTWENVLMLFLKLTVAKVCVDNAEWIVMIIYNGFSSIVSTTLGSSQTLEIIPTSNGVEMAQYFWLTSDQAQKLFPSPANTGFLNFEPMWLATKSEIIAMIMIILLIICNIIVIGRIFELVIYTIIAPIPLSTLACDGLTDIGKGFLKSYAAVCVQAIVLMVMFMAYSLLHGFLDNMAALNAVASWRGLIEVFTLALGVMQSGSWAKRICGAM